MKMAKIEAKQSIVKVPCKEEQGTKCNHAECRFDYYTDEATKAKKQWIAEWEAKQKKK